MKILISLILTCALANPQLQAQSNEKKVTLYIDDFKGLQREFGVGRYDYMYLVRDAISNFKSIRIPHGMKVTLFDGDNFHGSSIVLTDNANTNFLKAKGFAQTAQTISLIIEELSQASMPAEGTFVTIYKDDFSGASRNLLPGQYEWHELGDVGNDQLSSIKIPKGMKVTLYEHSGFTGRKLVLAQDTRASIFVANKFNDLTSSILVEEKPEPVPVAISKPVVMPTVSVTPPVSAESVLEPTLPTIYQSDFSGPAKSFDVGAYGIDQLGIGNDELSSIKVPYGFRVTLYEHAGFEGRKLVVTQNQRASFFAENKFNNVTSSILVEWIPMVTIYQGDYDGPSAKLGIGRYNLSKLGTMTDVSSARVPAGLRLILFEYENFSGRSTTLTRDTGTDLMTSYQFNNKANSFIVEKVEEEVTLKPQEKNSVIVYEDNFSGASRRLGPGRYDYRQLGIRDNSLSSIVIPPGFRVQLFDYAGFKQILMTLRTDTDVNFFIANACNDRVTAMIIDEIPQTDFTVTVYTDSFEGVSQNLLPGKYLARDLAVGNNSISSVRVPKGMQATLFDDADFSGYQFRAGRDVDLMNHSFGQNFDNITSSLLVEDFDSRYVHIEVGTETELPVQREKEEPEVLPVVPSEPVAPVVSTPTCEMTADQFQRVVNSVKSKPFRDEKMEMAKLGVKGKCLSNEQIRSIAEQFSFEDQTLEFVKHAYELSNEKSEYYLLENIFKFMSSRDEFMKFIRTK